MSRKHKAVWISTPPNTAQPVAAAKMQSDGMPLMTDGEITLPKTEALRLARIILDACGSHRVRLDNSMGYSAESGAWGSIDLVCEGCNAATEIVEA